MGSLFDLISLVTINDKNVIRMSKNDDSDYNYLALKILIVMMEV